MTAPALLASLLLTQASPTVGDFVASAMRANLDAQLAVAQADRAQATFAQAWLALLPTASVSSGWTHNQYPASTAIPNPQTGTTTELVIVPRNQFDASLRLDVPLVNTSAWLRTETAEASRTAARERSRATSLDVQLRVVQAFSSWAAALAVRDAAERSVAAARAQKDLAQARAETGVATELDVLRARAEVARTEQTHADAVALVQTSAHSLAMLSGREVPATATVNVDLDPSPVVQRNLEALPSIVAAEADLDAATTQATAARLALVPTVSGQFTQRLTNATGFQNQVATWSLGLSLSWRLDASSLQEWAVADASRSIAALTAARTRQQAADTLFAANARLEASRSKLASAQAQVDVSRRAAQVAAERALTGAASQIDVITAERDLFSAEVSLISARTDCASLQAAARVAAGLSLE
ncbi:MAG: TolC family protein [Myxococcaceae bacterium]|nr:TolC family protein [Myxococcaceae bacterium]